MKKILSLFLIGYSLINVCNAQFDTLLTFNGMNGSQPNASLLKSGNKLYGTAQLGGAGGLGNVFSINTDGTGYTDLFDFTYFQTAYMPNGIIMLGNRLYGIASSGGTQGGIFSIDTNGGGYTDLFDFNGSTKGGKPSGTLAYANGKFYGTTYSGGSSGIGLLFSIDTSGRNFKVLQEFSYSTGGNSECTVTISGNKIYGTTALYGAGGNGTVFSIDTNGTGFATLVNFNGSNGRDPEHGPLLLSNGILYGTTSAGGTYFDGTVFAVDTDGSAFHTLASLNITTIGNDPSYGMVFSPNGQLWGVAEGAGLSGTGTVFSLNSDGSGLKVRYGFSSFTNSPNGNVPIGSLVFSGSNYYGMTGLGGLNNAGIIFKSDTSACPLNISTIQITAGCGNDSTANVIALAIGGVSAYTYLWSDARSQTTDTAYGLKAGQTYTLTVTAGPGSCSATAVVTVTQPILLSANIQVSNPISCYGSNAIISGVGTGGTLAIFYGSGYSHYSYSYSWIDTGNNVVSSSGLYYYAVTSSYTVTITDAVGCSATASVTLTQPEPLRDSIVSIQNAYCNSDSSGSATFGAIGGTSPYYYNWINANAYGPTATGLSAGTYSVYISDDHGCHVIDSVTISQPARILSVSANQASSIPCNGGNNASANASVSGGFSPYTYLWSNGATNAAASNLSAGTYTLSVTDSNGCNKAVGVVITQPNAINPNVNIINISCNGGNNGSATSSPIYGTPPYSYVWSNTTSATTATVSNLSLGTYSVSVRDANGCSATASISISQPDIFKYIVAGTISEVSCNGGNNGHVNVSPVGGSLPYTYAWSNGTSTVATTQAPHTMRAGSYTVTVQDNCGATHTATAVVTQPNEMRDSAKTITAVGCYSGNAGSISLGAKGGNYPYNYQWSNGNTLVTVSNLSAGTYSVVVTDTKGCTNTVTGIVVTQPTVLSSNIATNCIGNRQGTLTLTGSGGTPAYKYAWSNGKTTSSITVADGNYTVKLTDAHGCSTTSGVTVACPGALNDEGGGDASELPACCGTMENITLYPNPNNGQFTITVESEKLKVENNVEIYNMLGQKVYSQSEIHNATFNINISDQPNGIYLIRILDKDGNLASQKKVVKTN